MKTVRNNQLSGNNQPTDGLLSVEMCFMAMFTMIKLLPLAAQTWLEMCAKADVYSRSSF